RRHPDDGEVVMRRTLVMRMRASLFAAVFGLLVPAGANAATEAPEPPDVHWSFEGIFGTYDREQLQRGFEVYRQVCATCHSMSLMYYRNLLAIGLPEATAAAIAAEQNVTDGPDDQGEMFERPARLSDRFVSPFPNEQAEIGRASCRE